MTNLKIPVAVNATGKVVKIENALKGEVYRCPQCATILILKKGEVKIARFAHKPNDVCNKETIIHKAAKLLIQAEVKDWKAGLKEAPTLVRKCGTCKLREAQKLPDKVIEALLEYRLPEGYVIDVALMGKDTQAQAAIEVKVSHAIDDDKANNLSIPYFEVDGNDIIVNPSTWIPLRDGFMPITCKKCRENYKLFREKCQEIAKECEIELPTEYYRYAPFGCWKCKKETLVFSWPGHENDIAPRPAGRPRTVQYRYSKVVGGKYWANVCGHCNILRGDFFLYSEPDSPLGGFVCAGDSEDDFKRDIARIANRWAEISA